jgi:hypothetical protein
MNAYIDEMKWNTSYINAENFDTLKTQPFLALNIWHKYEY